jgi:hypothetical protein
VLSSFVLRWALRWALRDHLIPVVSCTGVTFECIVTAMALEYFIFDRFAG